MATPRHYLIAGLSRRCVQSVESWEREPHRTRPTARAEFERAAVEADRILGAKPSQDSSPPPPQAA